MNPKLTLAVAALLLCSLAHSQESTTQKEQFKLIRGPNAIASVGIDLFGDTVNLYNGRLDFVQTDVSLRGNNNLPVMAGRRLSTGQHLSSDRPFAKWNLEIPHLHGVFASGPTSSHPAWVGFDGSTARCSNFGEPPQAVGVQGSSFWGAAEFWQGNSIYVPGHGDQQMLLRAPGYTRTPAPVNVDGVTVSTFPIVTGAQWAIGCLPTLKNGQQGEGFVAVSPDGTRYVFDWLVKYAAKTLRKKYPDPMLSGVAESPVSQAATALTTPEETATVEGQASSDFAGEGPAPDAVPTPSLVRYDVWILPSKVIDRFGNTVTYTYDPARPKNLLKIAASDGRELNFTYVPDGLGGFTHLVQTVADGSRTWTYSYDMATVKKLTVVTLPDATTWQLSEADNLLKDIVFITEGPCITRMTHSNLVLEATLVHPSGASGKFTLAPTEHGRSNVLYECVFETLMSPIYYVTHSATSKTISGPGLSPLTWTYQYDPANGSFDSCTNCPGTASVNITNPEGTVTRQVFGNRYFIDEGKLLQTFEGWDGSIAERTTTYAYQPSSSANPYPVQFGYSDERFGDSGSDLRIMPLQARTINQQGVNFNWRADTYDSVARPLQVTKFSSLNMVRTEATTYFDNDSKWVLGQVGQVISAGKTIVKNDYDPTTLLPAKVTRFNVEDMRMTYHTDGTLASLTQGKKTTQYANYKRGTAQNVSYAGTAITESSQINNLGNPDWTRDSALNATSYGYDAMGRLALVQYPGGDTTAWANTSISFAKSAASRYDLPAGHWVREIRTGNGVTAQYFDALFRPVYLEQWDSANAAGTLRITKKRFDSRGLETYQSYPKRSYGEIGDGIHSAFDALVRPTVTSTISELGTLYSGFNYSLGGFERHYSNNRQNVSLTRYQVFDDPSDAAIIGITEPEGVNIAITRDIFGKPLTVTRSGGGKTAIRTYVYDANERLCKTIEPETGATILEYDLNNNLAWRATGLSLPSTSSCDRATVTAASKISFTYDAMNRLTNTVYGDGSPGVARTYTYDSLPETTTSNGAVWTNSYNKRRLHTRESLAYGGAAYNIDHGYDANGSRSTLTYPDATVVAYAPNALGEATQVGSYASAVTYHPNGAVAGFRYGNGIQHTMTQNVRGLPEWSTDAGVLRDNYVYDKNANVSFIWDYQEGISNRGMTYDNLDRLTQVDSTMWAGASYTYDALDNLTSTYLVSGATARATTHTYSTVTNRLTNIASSNPAYNLAITYDTIGNVTKRGSQAFVFDRGNRMSSATGKGTYTYDGAGRRVSTVGTDGVNRITVYSQAGQLLFARASSTPLGAGTKYIHLRNHVIAESSPAGTQYDHTDGLGSPVAITNSSGGLVSRTRYEPYGLTFAGASPTIGFTGHLNAADIGLVYMQQRYYDPVAGRFLSIDPVSTDANSGSGFNRYTYANNNPYRYIDPDGRMSEQNCRDMVGNCTNVGGDNSGSQRAADTAVGVGLGATAGAAIGVGLSGACDIASSGACVPANPTIVAAGAAAGGAAGGILIPPVLASSRELAKILPRCLGK